MSREIFSPGITTMILFRRIFLLSSWLPPVWVFFFAGFFCRLILFYFILFKGERELDEILFIYLTLFDFICESENFCGSPGTKRGTIFNDFLGGRLATLP